jgi:hypothetical protein
VVFAGLPNFESNEYNLFMLRKHFLQQSAIITTGILLRPSLSFAGTREFPVVRIPESQRKFKSMAVEKLLLN